MCSDTLRVLRALRCRSELRLVVVAGKVDDTGLLAVVEIGVAGVVRRAEATPERLISVIESAAAGDGSIPPDLLGRLLSQVSMIQRDVLGPRGLNFTGLADREIEVLRLIAEGYDTAEIAAALSYSQRTVKTVLHDVTTRLNLRNRSHAVAYEPGRGDHHGQAGRRSVRELHEQPAPHQPGPPPVRSPPGHAPPPPSRQDTHRPRSGVPARVPATRRTSRRPVTHECPCPHIPEETARIKHRRAGDTSCLVAHFRLLPGLSPSRTPSARRAQHPRPATFGQLNEDDGFFDTYIDELYGHIDLAIPNGQTRGFNSAVITGYY
ncbi:response regulator transcription factor [Sphaerisporangium perillae]|uniref:response regulator transcription factor n=1 Tax=Sphaerisporangium perillae TaxID=2935860 RepID=UPI0020104E78|nr:response regulator transcription factor [Sphaerisporangium perillae]